MRVRLIASLQCQLGSCSQVIRNSLYAHRAAPFAVHVTTCASWLRPIHPFYVWLSWVHAYYCPGPGQTNGFLPSLSYHYSVDPSMYNQVSYFRTLVIDTGSKALISARVAVKYCAWLAIMAIWVDQAPSQVLYVELTNQRLRRLLLTLVLSCRLLVGRHMMLAMVALATPLQRQEAAR